MGPHRNLSCIKLSQAERGAGGEGGGGGGGGLEENRGDAFDIVSPKQRAPPVGEMFSCRMGNPPSAQIVSFYLFYFALRSFMLYHVIVLFYLILFYFICRRSLHQQPCQAPGSNALGVVYFSIAVMSGHRCDWEARSNTDPKTVEPSCAMRRDPAPVTPTVPRQYLAPCK